jgi:hypothetical protein
MKCEIVKIDDGYYLRKRSIWIGQYLYADKDRLQNNYQCMTNTMWWPDGYMKWAKFPTVESLEKAILNYKRKNDSVTVIKKLKFKF